MDTAAFAEKFQHLVNAADPDGMRNMSGLSEDHIAVVEAELQAVFPIDYIWFLTRYWTGMFGAVDLYTLQANDRSYIGKRQPEDASGRFLAFSDDGFGNSYCFPVDNGSCVDRVVIVPLLATEYTGRTVSGGFLDFLSDRA